MLKRKQTVFGTLTALALITGSGCAAIQGGKSPESSATGPTVVETRVEPGTVELNQDMKLNEPAMVVAQIQDLKSEVTQVTLRFLNAPVELPMEHVAGTAWRAQIPEQTAQRLAINDQTTKYEANVYARNADGEVGVSREPVEISIKAPKVAKAQTGTG